MARGVPRVDELAQLVRQAGDAPVARARAAIELGRELADAGDALIERFVAEARAAGVSWTEIGALFGTSKQAAQKRYGATGAAPGEWPGRWTPAARRALEHAAAHARELGHDYVGTEHALLGLLAAGDGHAAQVLAALGITREAWLAMAAPREPRPYGALALMPRFKQALEHARRLADRLGCEDAGTEHLLAGIVSVPDALAVEMLARHGVTAADVRAGLARQLEIEPDELVIRPPRRRLLAKSC
jgi:hypothetical protein